MNEHEFRWAVLLIVWSLFDANLREIPYVNTTVARRRCKYGGATWGPRKVQHLVRMCLERVQWFTQSFDVVQQDCLVRIHLSAIPVASRLWKRANLVCAASN